MLRRGMQELQFDSDSCGDAGDDFVLEGAVAVSYKDGGRAASPCAARGERPRVALAASCALAPVRARA